MSGRLDQIEHLLAECLGRAFLIARPDLPYSVNRILLGIGWADSSLTAIWHRLDSFLFNTIYNTTNKQMLLIQDDHRKIRATEDMITDLADRLVALTYVSSNPSPELENQLYDLSRNGSYCAMRLLLEKYHPTDDEREMILRVLRENNQLH
ncbi:MAG: hypothetical protein IJ088_09920 [Clostridia bacterium]|nr:hypothetical protein [Clostridia bacterium]